MAESFVISRSSSLFPGRKLGEVSRNGSRIGEPGSRTWSRGRRATGLVSGRLAERRSSAAVRPARQSFTRDGREHDGRFAIARDRNTTVAILIASMQLGGATHAGHGSSTTRRPRSFAVNPHLLRSRRDVKAFQLQTRSK
jgi:hypothetical protein